MPRIKFDDLKAEFKRVLIKKGCDETTADISAQLMTETSCDGVYSHGVNRFPRVIEYIDKGYIDLKAKPTKTESMGAFERWNGNLGFGNVNAKLSMDRAIELAKQYGIGCVALGNTNHWLRGGSYGWQAADAGCIGICWTNTQPNMPAWGAKDRRIGNNPYIMAIPRKEGHVVVDIAMAQFSYGRWNRPPCAAICCQWLVAMMKKAISPVTRRKSPKPGAYCPSVSGKAHPCPLSWI